MPGITVIANQRLLVNNHFLHRPRVFRNIRIGGSRIPRRFLLGPIWCSSIRWFLPRLPFCYVGKSRWWKPGLECLLPRPWYGRCRNLFPNKRSLDWGTNYPSERSGYPLHLTSQFIHWNGNSLNWLPNKKTRKKRMRLLGKILLSLNLMEAFSYTLIIVTSHRKRTSHPSFT